MFSNFRCLRSARAAKIAGASFILCALAFVFGCGLNTNERPRKPDPPSFSGKGYSCIGEIPEHFERYFRDQMSEGDINEFVRCLQKSVTSFAQLTRGQDEATYAPGEIRRFLQSYFLKERSINDQLMHEFMVTKQALIGGEVDRITRNELYTAIDVLEDLRKELIRLKPHMQVLNPNLAVTQAPAGLKARLDDARTALHQSISTFTTRLEKSQRLYSFADMQSLFLEFREYVSWEKHFADAQPLPAWIGMLRAFKVAAVSPKDPRGIAAHEWQPLLSSLSRWYLTYLQYWVGVRDQNMLEGIGLQNAVYLEEEVFGLMNEAISHQPQRTLGFEPLMNVIEAAQGLGWISPKLRLCGLRSSIEGLVMRMYGDEHVPPASRQGDLGLTANALTLMHQDFLRWGTTQLNLDKVYRYPTRSHVTEVHQARLQPDIIAQLREPRGADWTDFQRVKQLMKRPLFPEEVSRVYLVNETRLAEHGLTNQFFNLSSMNILRALVTAIFRGYAKYGLNTDGYKTGILSGEMQTFYEDFRETGIDLGLVDKRKFRAGSQAFMEANLFTYASRGLRADLDDDGEPIPPGWKHRYRDRGWGHTPTHKTSREDGALSFVETMQYFAFLYSGGKVANSIFDDLAERCPLGPLDQYEKPMLGRDCVRNAMPEMIVAHAFNMPGLQDFLRASSPEKALRFSDFIIKAVHNDDMTPEGWVEYSEMTSISGMLHYLEALMTRFDANNDGKMNLKEINEAAAIFSGFLQTYAREQLKFDLSTTDALATFRFILYHRRLPAESGPAMLRDFAEIGAKWAQAATTPRFSIDRGGLAEVFELIISKLSKSTGSEPTHKLNTCNAAHGGE